MKRILSTIFAGMFVLVFTCIDLHAQATAQIGGTVKDQSGAVLPGVEVTVTQTDTGIRRMVVTDETGSYILPNLPLGPYRLEAGLPGFRSFVQTGIVLQVNSNPTIAILLEVGQITEQVEVQANASLVETRSVGIGQIMENERIVELPLNGRNAAELMLLSGGNVQIAANSGAGRTLPDRLVISSAGGLAQGTDYHLDGIRHVDAYDGQSMPLPFPDALQEFKVETSGLTASYGRGASVNAVTKSGTNDFHGDLFEFVRNDLFNARQFYAPTNSTLKRNQFGGTAGGPIQKNRLFFFGGYQGTKLRQDPADTQTFVPTAAMLAGDFTSFASAACNTRGAVTLRAPFASNRIDPALFSKAALNVAGRLPKTSDPCGKLVYGRRTDQNNVQMLGKGDYQQSEKHSLFTRYVWDRSQRPSAYASTPDNVLNTGSNGTINIGHSFTLGSTYLVTPNTVNALRIGFNRTNSQRFNPPFFDANDIGVKDAYTYIPDKINLSVTNGFSLSGASDATWRTTTYLLSDDMSFVSGAHQFAFGFSMAHARTNGIANQAVVGNYNFDGSITGLGLADFLTGRMIQFSEGAANRFYVRVNYPSLYAQDVWKVSSRFTVNYGLRWEPVLSLKDYRQPVPSVMHFDVERFKQGLRSTVFPNAPPGMLYTGDPEFQLTNHQVFKPNWPLFGPHLGFAWDMTGDGKTSLRASYGLNHMTMPTQLRQGEAIGQPPWGNLTVVDSPVGGLDDPWRGYPGGNPFPIQLAKTTTFPPFGQYISQNYKMDPTYTQSWNMTLQREVVSGTLVSLSYLGSQTTHLWAINPLNNAQFVPGVGDASGTCFLNGQAVNYRVAAGAACSTTANTQSRRTLSLINSTNGNFGRTGEYTMGGTQIYNGMLLSVQHQSRRGITLNGNYAWSRCIGDYAGRTLFGYSLQTDEAYLDPNNRRRDRADCEFIDVRQALNLTAVAETPRFSGRTLRMIASGWRLSGIYRRSTNLGGLLATTGGYVSARTVVTGVDRSLNGESRLQRPNQILENVYLDKSGGPSSQYLNPAAFAQPALGTTGNMGRVSLDPPGTWQFDLALARVFQIRESQRLEFRAEAYNVTNSFRPGNPVTNLNSNQFGQIITSLDPRILQFALKYVF